MPRTISVTARHWVAGDRRKAPPVAKYAI